MNQAVDKLNENILASLEKGVVPWRQTWTGVRSRNVVSNKEYHGINVWLLQGYNQSGWLTFQQAKKLGGSINAGEHASTIFFFTTNYTKKSKDDDGTEVYEIIELQHPVMKCFSVFNVEQCWFPTSVKEKVMDPVNANSKVRSCEEIVSLYKDCPTIEIGKPSYSPVSDIIWMPEIERFETSEEYYLTLFHEMAHSTGHDKRLNRHLVENHNNKHDYGFEELVSEFASGYLINEAGLNFNENSVAYLQGWMKAIQNDRNLLMKAASNGEKAYNYIVGQGVA